MKLHKSWGSIILTSGLALLALLALGLWVTSHPAQAGTLTVCSVGCGYTTIQGAVDAAADGDIILVANETFSESIVITKSVTLMGGYTSLPGDTSTRIPRSTVVTSTGRIIQIGGTGITGLDVTVDGFEIADGGGEGIYVDVVDDVAIVINDNYIHDNNATGISAAIDNRSYLQITNNDVFSNTEAGNYGGIYADGFMSATLVITGNRIIHNIAGISYGGARIGLEAFIQFTIEDNIVMSNTATTGQGGGLYFYADYQATGTFDRNQFTGNIAGTDYGGAYVYLAYGSSSTFYDNEFSGQLRR